MCTSCLVVVFNTQPQAVISMHVHACTGMYMYLPGSAYTCIVFYNTQSIGSVSYMHPPMLAT